MKNSIKLSVLALMVGFVISGCTKTDLSSSDSISLMVSSDAAAPDLNKCKVRRIYQGGGPSGSSTALFTYNSAGNPYSVVYSDGGTAFPNHYFFYDAQNRLKRYELRWGPVYVHEYHYYRYNNLNQIIIDSIVRSDANDAYPYEAVSYIEYDAQGRVVKETTVNIKNGNEPLQGTRRPTYTYDLRGNLGVNGWRSSSYDYKINPLQQNAVFRFIMRNYSKNNAAVQPRYNSIGLPLSMNPSNDNFFNTLYTLKVVYDCQ